jgi:prevent-host-death family protein
MAVVGVRELKTRASEILRDVRDHRARYTVTYRGRPVGVLLPLAEVTPDDRNRDDGWDELIRLGEQIGRGWRSSQTSVELLSEMRR